MLLGVFCAGLAIGFAAVFIQSRIHSNAARTVELQHEAAEASANLLRLAEQESLQQMQQRKVYPYSVVPGGVRDAHELKWVTEHDPVVKAHYARFDFDHARVVKLDRPRLFFVSYRIGNKVFWTRRRLLLRKGELLITDGKIAARSRCGNQVEEVPQQATSVSEPPAEKFDEPMQPAKGTAEAAPPVPFESALMNRPGVPGLGPALPLSLYDPIGNSNWVPISPPPLPSVCGVGKPKKGGSAPPPTTGKKGKGDPCGGGAGGAGGEVPEPSTWLLVAMGFAAICWKARQRFVHTI